MGVRPTSVADSRSSGRRSGPALLAWRKLGVATTMVFLCADEIGNLPWLLDTPYRAILHILPQYVYNDRPIGEALERFLYERFGFDYRRRQLACFLCLHFANCLLVFLTFRRLGVSAALSLAGTGFFGSLSTTAFTATYLGASFDVLCTFFLLGSILTSLEERRLAWYASALLFFLALRSKEFAIVTPLLLTFLLLCCQRHSTWQRAASEVRRRLWIHYLILAIVGIRYLSFVPGMRAAIGTKHPYYLDPGFVTIFKSIAYYSSLIFTLENRGHVTVLALLCLAFIVVYAILRRRYLILFAYAAYGLTLLPVAMLPNMRQPLYAYGPQIFLILAICLFLEDIVAAATVNTSSRWTREVCFAAVLLACGFAIRTSDYFRDRIGFDRDVRETCARTAREASVQLYDINEGARLYISSGRSTPWLMTAGPCDYLKLWRHDRKISCVIMKPEQELLELYARDGGGSGGKYFVDYYPDGSLRVRLSAR